MLVNFFSGSNGSYTRVVVAASFMAEVLMIRMMSSTNFFDWITPVFSSRLHAKSASRKLFRMDIDLLRLRSAVRNLDLDINRVSEPREMFVHLVRVADRAPIEVHVPIEWVSIDAEDVVVFNGEASRAIGEAEELVRR